MPCFCSCLNCILTDSSKVIHVSWPPVQLPVTFSHGILMQAAWGSHALVVAARELLRAALRDPHNQRFILLSETAVPMYPPTVTYHQLVNEQKSRVNACRHGVCFARHTAC